MPKDGSSLKIDASMLHFRDPSGGGDQAMLPAGSAELGRKFPALDLTERREPFMEELHSIAMLMAIFGCGCC